MTKRRIPFFLAFIIVILFSAVSCKNEGRLYRVRTFRSGNGWGYDVTINGKTYIHQPFIPAVEGEMPFTDRSSAKKTGRLVISKIRNHKSPTVTREELEKITGKPEK